jgi:glutathione S-transferase
VNRPRLFGADYSVYVRIARLALEEKHVDYERVPVDIFDPAGPPDWYRDLQPFGRIPALDDNGFVLFETAAITRYVDEAFAGQPLQPAGAKARARMNQVVAILDHYAYRAMVWDVYVERISKPAEGRQPDEARIAAALLVARTCLATLAKIKGTNAWLASGELTLADLHAAPIIAYFLKAPEGNALLAGFPDLGDWWARMCARPSFRATEPAD